jgi:acetoin utilization protein AcuB
MIRIPKIKSVMTAFPYSVKVETPVKEALEIMQSYRIRHLPVMRNTEVAGIISDRDIKLILGPDFAYPEPEKLMVGDLLLPEPYIADLEERLDVVLTHMATHHINYAVITRRGALVGLFTSTDAHRAFADFLRDQFRRSGGDDAA